MKAKKPLYYRKKNYFNEDRKRNEKSFIIEGKLPDGSSLNIWTLPSKPIVLLEFLLKASYFSTEKSEKIKEKLKRLGIDLDKGTETSLNLPLININRNEENDAIIELPEDEINKSLEESKEKGII